MVDRIPYFMQALSPLIINKQKICSDEFLPKQCSKIKKNHIKIFYLEHELYICTLTTLNVFDTVESQ